MAEAIKLETPLGAREIERLRIGDKVLLNGEIYTGRDAAHKRLVEQLQRGEPLPFPLEGAVIYYVGPAPAKPGMAIGPAGPTTSYRMDPYTPALLEQGLKGMIGKGNRGKEVREALKRHKAVYFISTGGAAALVAERIKRAELVAYEDLGPEAVQRLIVADFPVIVANDIYGGDIYEEGKKRYRKEPVL
ncbi:MAG: Fe-S-containing hydro-lyase [Candidatus Acetothermia bacterium]|nr:Fe-S-containing hydro-lyase [Candidatus Acetothermia bacterium]MDH7505501.1 Fe-S-containing hydro-lyase [Candidatus Acetothermia bacterium]